MKKLNVFVKIMIASICTIAMIFCTNVYGTQSNTDQYLMMYGKSSGRPTGFYWVHAGDSQDRPVIKIVRSSDANGTSSLAEDASEAIFCIKDGIGFGSSDGNGGHTASVVNYNQYFDMRKPSEIPSPYSGKLPQGEEYNKLMWVLENAVNPSDSVATQNLLEAAGISDEDFQNYKQAEFNNSSTEAIKKDIIEVAEQAAIWHYTNKGTEYDPGEMTNFSRTDMYTLENHINIEDYYGSVKDEPLGTLYNYFITNADDAADYDYSQGGLAKISLDKSAVTSTFDGSNILIGPYKVNKVGNGNYTLVATVTDGTNDIADAKIIGSDKKTEISGVNISEKVKSTVGNDFYVAVPANTSASNVTISISGSVTGKTITYWSAPAATIEVTQPVAITKNLTQSYKDSDTKAIVKPEFDLALRKFIISINGVAPAVSREPQITQESLKDLAEKKSEFNNGKTAVKTHTKAPLTVKSGDKVAYTIRIYNEGDVDGKATEITDYLPEGLTLSENSTINTKYGWKVDAQNSKKITTAYLANTNLVAFNKVPTDGKYTISYADVQVECDVIPNVTSTTNLKNVAEITNETNNLNLPDRDSVPNNLTDNQRSNYNPGASTRGKGYEDDDDYEDLTPLPQKYFDLALRKFIISINGTAPTISRKPAITQNNLKALATGSSDSFDGTTTYKEHTKDPLTVKSGDKVVYTIRIYNESDVDGKATEITDYLPEGLTLSENSTINTKYGWKVDAQNSKKITTAYLANTNLVAFNKTPADGKYTISYADVQVECDVIPNLTKTTKLKNVAEITKETNDENLPDRDSIPNNLTDDQKNNYNPGTSTKGKGYEDDDDYEDLTPLPQITPPPQKYFDLALRKFITSINGNAPEVSREPVITQDDLRALAEGSADFDNGRTVTKTHTKDPLIVKTGDKVVYTIRIYNEGDVDGKATEITDYLPDGLILSANSAINIRYGWKADAQDPKKITTSYLANTNLAAFNKKPTDGQYVISYADVQVECDIASNINNDTNLRNIAEITKSTNDSNLPDRDSVPDDLTNDQKNNYNPGTSPNGKGYEDDDDYEDLVPNNYFDLALRKFIVSINGQAPKISREPVITQDNLMALATGSSDSFDGTTTHKEHTKDPLEVSTGDKVIYTIRIYNEGNINGKATEITDYLPDGLKLTENSEINSKYGWKVDASNSQIIRTAYLANTTLNAFDVNPVNGQYVMSKEGGQIADVQVECDVIATSAVAKHLKNVAEITKATNDSNLPDRDSTPSNLSDEQKENYNPNTSTEGKGYEDDDDYEDLLLTRFDLALRKFITGVNDVQVTNRVPQVDTSKFGTIVDGKEITTCTYNHTKEPVRVEHNDIVTYTIRIYNEGTTEGYAAVVKDDLPEGIVYLPDNQTNIEYRWKMYDADGNETDDVTKATYVTTDYLSKEQEKTEGANLLKAFDKDTMSTPDYRDVKIAFRVTMPNTSDRIVINKAQISKHTDSDGNEPNDIDSTPDKWNEGEDDQDIEKIYVKYFDLALRKWVTQAIVIEDGNEKIMNTGHKAEDDPESVVKVEINKKRLNDTVVKFRYSIRITNEGEIAGYATEISDYIPTGLKFNQADNPEWREVNGKIVTNALKDQLLQPGEQAFVDVVLTWINDENNMGVKTNVAEISEDKNNSDTPDIDSTPNNKKNGEDDIDDAPVALTVNAGRAPTYSVLIASILTIVGIGAILIKKFVIQDRK